MPIQGTVPVGGSFAPTDAADSFGTHNDKWGVGGYRIVKTIADRDAIPINESNLLNLDDELASGRRKLGMMVYVSDENKFYVLTIAQATWEGYNEGQKVAALEDNNNFIEFVGGEGTEVLWNFTGAYNVGAAYAVGDIATYDGETWYRIDAHGGNTGDTPAEGTFWTLIAAKGVDGADGTDGVLLYGNATNGGSGNDYTATIGTATSYTEGDSYIIKFDANNTGSSRININDIGLVRIYKVVTTQLEADDIIADKIYILTYDGNDFQLVTLGGGGGSSGGVDYYISTGTADTYTVSEITTYETGDAYTIKFNLANTGPSTLNGYSLKDSKTQGNLIPGDIIADQIHLAVFNGTDFELLTVKTKVSAGTGGGGVVYYLNFDTAGEVPLTNIPQTPNTTKELGLSGETTPTSYQSAHLSTGSYDFLASFVTDVGFPSAETIPAGIWDFNIFAESSSTNSANQVYFQVKIYQYDDTETLTLLGTSSDVYIYDPAEINQYVASIIVPQTTLLETDRIVVYLYGRSHQSNKHITFHFGGSYPSHVHTTLSSVSGTGFVTVTNGIFDPVASSTINVNKLTAGTANQVLRMPDSDSPPAWGAINLASSAAVTGTLAIGNGGTGFSSYAIGDLLYADTTTSLAKLAGVAAGSVLISNGTNTAPSWSTGPTLRSIILNNASNANTITLNTGATAAGSGSGYTLTLPIAAPAAGQYLQFALGGVATWVNGTVNGVTTMAAIGAVPNANGASIASSTLTLQPASASFGGVVTTGTQTFAGAKTFSSAVTINATTSQIVLGTTNTTTITSPAPTASRVYTIPDTATATASFVMTQGAQTITGIKTFVSNAGPIQFNDIINVSTPTAGATPSVGTRIVIAPGDATPNTPLSLGIASSYEFWMAGRHFISFYPKNQTTSVATFDYVTTGNGTTGLILSSTYSTTVPALRSTGWIFAAGASAGGAVSTGTRSAGTKIVLRDNIGFAGDASIGTTESGGANTTEMWFTSPSRIAFYTNNVTNNKLVITSAGVTVTSDVGFYGTAPVAKGTTANITGLGFSQVNTTTLVSTASTFGGYTLAQIAAALQRLGLIT